MERTHGKIDFVVERAVPGLRMKIAKLHRLFDGVEGVHIVDGFEPSAAYMASLSDQALKAGRFVDVAYFEPFYLKDFVAGKPHVKGL